ncbi:MAG: SLOG family protein [Candidatus Howiella sp.]|jgi:uncharacterized phage-like protein YoqJ
MTDEFACCFTGYRPEKFNFDFTPGTPEYTQFENNLTNAVYRMADRGCGVFYSGVAQGFDIAAAEVVLLRRQQEGDVALRCVLPFRDQAAAWALPWKRRYLEVLKAADEIIILSESYYKGCFARRNKYMVDHARAVITYFDGTAGGTASTVRLAERRGLEIINIFDPYQQLALELP